MEERDHRLSIWNQLPGDGQIKRAEPSLLRALGIYGGAQGIWVDKARTASIGSNGAGVSVGLLHTGSSYADDLSDDCILYHYPTTNRTGSRDTAEIDATKNAKTLGAPVFVITYPAPNSKFRDVHLGWVEDWDDNARVFLIGFGDQFSKNTPDTDDAPFELHTPTTKQVRQIAARPGQQRFKFNVFKRYGATCAFCGLAVVELIDAAHLCPKEHFGTDDPRNGLPLCALHHRVLDCGFVAIEPNSFAIKVRSGGPSLTSLRITNTSLGNLPHKPHHAAIQWRWERWSPTA